MNSNDAKLIVDILLENGADVNIVNRSGESPLFRAAVGELTDVVDQMLRVRGASPNNRSSSEKSPLYAACHVNNVELVDTLLKRGADPNLASASYDRDTKITFPLFVATRSCNADIIKLLLNAGANINATNHEGKNAVCLAADTGSGYPPEDRMRNILLTIRFLLQQGANFNMVMADGHSPPYLAVNNLPNMRECEDWRKAIVGELVQLMVKYGAMLQDSYCPTRDICHKSLNSGILLIALATFDGSHEFIVDLFRAGTGFQLLAHFCNAVATSPPEAKSTCMCQAVVLAGYVPSAEELQSLQVAAASEKNAAGRILEQLLNWLIEDRQQVPSLLRQCRIAIRRQLSVATHFQTILPAIDELPLPGDELALYLQFDGPLTEVQLVVKRKTPEETSVEDGYD